MGIWRGREGCQYSTDVCPVYLFHLAVVICILYDRLAVGTREAALGLIEVSRDFWLCCRREFKTNKCESGLGFVIRRF